MSRSLQLAPSSYLAGMLAAILIAIGPLMVSGQSDGPVSGPDRYPSTDGIPSPSTEPAGPSLPIESSQTIARVGREVVLAGDIAVQVIDTLLQSASQKSDDPEKNEQLRQFLTPERMSVERSQSMQSHLTRLLQMKLLYAEARRTIPEENLPKIQERLDERFEGVVIPQLYNLFEVETRAELDGRLRDLDSSVTQQKRAFSERVLALQWLFDQSRSDETVHYDELLNYYNEHLADYEFDAQARWEEIVVKVDRDREQARHSAGRLGNMVLDGAPFAEVAKNYSQGITASEGGRYDWTTRGSLIFAAVDQAIFSLPIGQLSRILEEDRSFHIVRVLERKEAGRTPFEDVQDEIREAITKGQANRKRSEYLDRLSKKIPIWTIFDKPGQSSAGPLPETSSRQ